MPSRLTGPPQSSDNCSKSPDNPLSFAFQPYCQRHDFGLRNAIKMHRCNDAYKERVHQNFQYARMRNCFPPN